MNHSPIRTASILWILFAVILAIVVFHAPHIHTVTHSYRRAAEGWAEHRDLYELRTVHGFLYLPQAAIAFMPIEMLPFRIGDVLWRWIGLALLAMSLLRLAEAFGRPDWFLPFTLVVIPGLFASARNGQTNCFLAAVFIYTALALRRERWTPALFWLLFAIVLKPVSIVPVLLVGALFPAMRLRLLIGMTILLALPFLDPNWDYVIRQYTLCWQKMTLARQPLEHSFADFSGMMWTFGHPMPLETIQLLGIVMAGVVLGFAWWAQKIDQPGTPFWVMTLSATYLMLFNPRTEANSYILLGVAVLPFLADAWKRGARPVVALGAMPGTPKPRSAEAERLRVEPRLWITLLILLGCESYGNPIDPWTRLWLKPLLALIFLIYLFVRIARKKPLVNSASSVNLSGPTGN